MAFDFLAHYGMLERSGRYPWGSGENPYQRLQDFRSTVRGLEEKGLTEKEIADYYKISTTQLRARKTIARNEIAKADIARVLQLKNKGYSNVAIGEKLGMPESTVRNMLNPVYQARVEKMGEAADLLRKEVEAKTYIDVGGGTEHYLGMSSTKLNATLNLLEEDGYKVVYVQETQVGTGKPTTIKVLCKDDIPYSEVAKHKSEIALPGVYSEDGGETFRKVEEPRAVSSKRVEVRYAEDGGIDRDGVIEVRRGVPELDMKDANYCQVRIELDDPAGKCYLKGMCIYADDLPDGVDIRVNSNKHRGTPMFDPNDSEHSVAKKLKNDPDNPFGASIKGDDDLIRAQRHYIDENGKEQLSALNIVNEEGDWGNWSKSLSSQMLSKQPPALAKKQLDIAYDSKKAEYDEIMQLTNPTVQKYLLAKFADGCDSDAVHLKAAALPGQASHVILPFTSIKDGEIYAPGYNNGDKVVLIRYPHGGKFEIPECTVNNNNKDAKKVIGSSRDAVGINSHTAAILSGADFDGDTVLVIPNNSGAVKRSNPLKGLEGFDPKEAYPYREGMKVMGKKQKQQKMGDVSNLITDMTIKGADESELARAVRHSMVVIDAEKHKLDYEQSYKDNDIAGLKRKYQGVNEKGQLKGASTLISKASSTQYVNERKEGQTVIDENGKKHLYLWSPETGEKLYTETGRTRNKRRKDGTYSDKTEVVQEKSTKMAEAKDAHELSSGTLIEGIYADHANRLKSLGNTARKAIFTIHDIQTNPTAKKAYQAEVDSMLADLREAERNAPLERKAQLLANSKIRLYKQDHPGLDDDSYKKYKSRALKEARDVVGSGKKQIIMTEKRWEAIQAGAVSKSRLERILANSDIDSVRQFAMPKNTKGLADSKVNHAKAMLARGYTRAEVADALGVSVSTLDRALE